MPSESITAGALRAPVQPSAKPQTKKCGGDKSLEELYEVLPRCYRRGVSWTDYMGVISLSTSAP